MLPFITGNLSVLSISNVILVCEIWVDLVQYKFIVDGGWRYDPSLQTAYDNDNNVNNVLEVREYVPENLESLRTFEPPPSPPER